MGIRNGTLVITIVAIASVLLLSNFSSVYANHVPTDIDIDELWSAPAGFKDGYLEFINPIEPEVKDFLGTIVMTSPPQIIQTEEFTGYTLADGTDIIETADNDMTHGDKADFDWVQEDRLQELSGTGNHGFLIGAMGWTIGSPDMSAHMDVTGQHAHSVVESPPGTLPELPNDACTGKFEFVDVFSIISSGEDTDTGDDDEDIRRNRALDYVVDFADSTNPLASTRGIPVLVFTQGWTPITNIDDYVARWVPEVSGKYDIIAIEPISTTVNENNNHGHDLVIEIDAVKCYITSNIVVGGEMMPIDTTAVLIAGIQTNAYGILGTFVTIGAIAFGALVISVKRNQTNKNLM